MSTFHEDINGYIAIPGTYTAAGGTTNFHIGAAPDQGRGAKPCKPFHTVPFVPDPDFIDRPEILAWVDEKCAKPGARAALVGFGGMGVYDANPEMFVFWVNAGTKARFKQAYKEIADRLELAERNDPKADVMQVVFNWLRHEQNGKWMMILDNADNIDIFHSKRAISNDRSSSTSKSLEDYIPQSRNGSILVTSRSKDAAVRLVGGYPNIKEVSALGEDQALQLLKHKLYGSPDEKDAYELLRVLGYLPLAITQAAAYINQSGTEVSVSTYLSDFRKSLQRKESFLNQEFDDLRRDKSASNSVVAAWQLTFERIRKKRKSATKLLSLMSLFNPQAIPSFALQEYNEPRGARYVIAAIQNSRRKKSNHEQDCFADDMAILQAYSLVSATTEKGVFKIHPLVQHCTLRWLSSAGKLESWRKIFLDTMRKELELKKLQNWDESKQLIAHLDAFYSEDLNGQAFHDWDQLTESVAILLYNKYKYNEAEILVRRRPEAREKKFGKNHPDTLGSLSSLAAILGGQGRYDESERLLRHALQAQEEILGKNHPDTLNTVGRLGLTMWARGQHDEAEKLFRRELQEREKTSGNRHQYTLRAMRSLADVLNDQEKHDESEMLLRRALGDFDKLDMQDHDTLASVSQLADMLHKQGKCEEAEKLLRQVLEGYERVLGKQQPETLIISVRELAGNLSAQGKYDEAEKLYQRAIEGSENELGADHPFTLYCLYTFAWMRQDQKRLHEAETLFRRALLGQVQKLGFGHPDTLSSLSGLAHALNDQKRYKEAEELFRQVYQGQEKCLGPQHRYTLSSILDLAMNLGAQKQYQQAEEYFRLAYDRFEQTLGPDHPLTIKCLEYLSEMQLETQSSGTTGSLSPSQSNPSSPVEPDGSRDSASPKPENEI